MNKFIVFSYNNYYPLGGWLDNRGVFDTFEEAMQVAMQFVGHHNNICIVNLETKEESWI